MRVLSTTICILLFQTGFAAPPRPPTITTKLDPQADVNRAFLNHIKNAVELRDRANDLSEPLVRNTINPSNIGSWQEVITILVECNKHLEKTQELLKPLALAISDNDSLSLKNKVEMSLLLFKESNETVDEAKEVCGILNTKPLNILQRMRATVHITERLEMSMRKRFESIRYMMEVISKKFPDVEVPDIELLMV